MGSARSQVGSDNIELLAVWIKSHADGSSHTRRVYERIGRRFLEGLDRAGTNLRRARIDDTAGRARGMRITDQGTAASTASASRASTPRR